jgi:hypothetical protein
MNGEQLFEVLKRRALVSDENDIEWRWFTPAMRAYYNEAAEEITFLCVMQGGAEEFPQ